MHHYLRRCRPGAIVLLAALLLAACQPSVHSAVTATTVPPTSTNSAPPPTILVIQPTGSDLILFTPTRPRGTPTRSGVADCFWGASVFVWQDDYGDGKQGGDEPSLAGVPAVLTRPGIGAVRDPRYTNDAGMLTFYLSTSCPMEEYGVEVLVPTGYRATTPTRITGIGGLTLRVGLVRE